MKHLLFAVKRLFVSFRFPLFLLLLLILPLLAQRAAGEVAVPAPVYAIEGQADADAARMAACLEEAGFAQADSAGEARDAVARGRADAAVIIPGNISSNLANKDFKAALIFVKSPNSLQADLWQEHAAAALFTVYAPYIMADALDGSGLSEEEIFAAYYDRIESGALFRFELESAKGYLTPLSERQDRFFLGAMSLLLFAACLYGAAEPLADETKTLSARIGKRRALLSFFLPGAVIRYGLFYLAAACASLLCGRAAMLLPLLFYVLLLAIYGSLLKLIPGKNWQGIFCLFLLLLSLALCPIYTDLSLVVPAVAIARCFLPPWWLWIL